MALCVLPTATAHAVDVTPQAACISGAKKYDVGTLGYVEWLQDPNTLCGYPGDSFRICDDNADGWGIQVDRYLTGLTDDTYLDSRSTAGHAAGYCTGWDSYNLNEGTSVKLVAYGVKSGHFADTEYTFYVHT